MDWTDPVKYSWRIVSRVFLGQQIRSPLQPDQALVLLREEYGKRLGKCFQIVSCSGVAPVPEIHAGVDLNGIRQLRQILREDPQFFNGAPDVMKEKPLSIFQIPVCGIQLLLHLTGEIAIELLGGTDSPVRLPLDVGLLLAPERLQA